MLSKGREATIWSLNDFPYGNVNSRFLPRVKVEDERDSQCDLGISLVTGVVTNELCHVGGHHRQTSSDQLVQLFLLRVNKYEEESEGGTHRLIMFEEALDES